MLWSPSETEHALWTFYNFIIFPSFLLVLFDHISLRFLQLTEPCHEHKQHKRHKLKTRQRSSPFPQNGSISHFLPGRWRSAMPWRGPQRRSRCRRWCEEYHPWNIDRRVALWTFMNCLVISAAGWKFSFHVLYFLLYSKIPSRNILWSWRRLNSCTEIRLDYGIHLHHTSGMSQCELRRIVRRVPKVRGFLCRFRFGGKWTGFVRLQVDNVSEYSTFQLN